MIIPACKCGCGLYVVEPKLENITDLLMLEFPGIEWTSGSRCQTHNASPQVRGSATSGHLPIWGEHGIQSVAVDGTLQPWDSYLVREILRRAVKHGARGIGYMPDIKAFHLDRKPRTAWWKVEGGLGGKYEDFF